MNRVRTWLLILAAVLTMACPLGVASAAASCGPVEANSQHSSGCPGLHKMSPDAMNCAPTCLALAPVVAAPSPPKITNFPIAGKLISLVETIGGPEPPPPRMA